MNLEVLPSLISLTLRYLNPHCQFEIAEETFR